MSTRNDGITANDRILIVDFGSQFTQLIARRVRDARVYCEIHPPTRSLEWIRAWRPAGIILSGGPNSVYGEQVPTADRAIFDIAPVLGICYGMQLIAHLEGATVLRAGRREYGRAEITVQDATGLFDGFTDGEPLTVWMSHGDHVDAPPPGYVTTATGVGTPVGAFRHATRPIHGVQFHPEVVHTPRGNDVINNFLFTICGVSPRGLPARSSTRRSPRSTRASARRR